MRHETEGAKLVAVGRFSLSHGLSHGCVFLDFLTEGKLFP
jgi:hypothetical protein